MRILLITNYWYPYNNPGAFRWMGFGKYIKFDVLTSVRPRSGSLDYTITRPDNKTYRFGSRFPAVLWGILAPLWGIFHDYDVYIITSPPESLLLGAYLLQLIGKKVLVDMRDSIDREKQYFKFMIPIYKFFYNRMRNVIVAWQFIDPAKEVIYTGYDEIKKAAITSIVPIYYKKRVHRANYLQLLRHGYIHDYSDKPEGYAASSFHTIKYLGYEILPGFHPEVYEYIPESFKQGSDKIINILNNLNS